MTRKPNPHLAFGGGGTHFCLGANLARVEAAALVPEVLSRMQNMELAGPVERMPSALINGIHSMPVRFTPARRNLCEPLIIERYILWIPRHSHLSC